MPSSKKKSSAIPRKTTVKQLNEALRFLRKVVKYLDKQNTFVSNRLSEGAKKILDHNFDEPIKSEKDISRPIPGYEGLYSCYEDGDIKSHGRIVGNSYVPEGIFRPGRFLRPRPNNEGYLAVRLTDRKGICKTLFVSRLVALTYHGPNELYVNHIDGNPLNNHYTNLEYVTQKENVQHYLRLGLKKTFGHPPGIKVKRIDKDTAESVEYRSVARCAKENNADPSSIHYHLQKPGRLFKSKYYIQHG